VISLESKIAAADGRPLGFDYLRVALAVGVVVAHAVIVHIDSWKFLGEMTPMRRLSFGYFVPMFIALSGFLVASSLERSRSLFGFIALRALRIVPALAMVVLLSSLVLGPIFTHLSPTDYFSHREFWAYLLNIVGYIHYGLPAVFKDHPWPEVNSQLWTVPIELACYVGLAVLAAFGLIRRRWLLLGVVIAVQIGLLGWAVMASPGIIEGGYYYPMSLVACFLFGVALYAFRDKVPWSLPLFLLSIAAMVAMMASYKGEFLFGLPTAYAAVYLGLTNPPRNRLVLSGDYSYGIYLYGFPIQQAVYALGPWTHRWEINLLISLPLTILLAVISWRFVEKPALGLRRIFSRRPPPAADPGEPGGGIAAVADTARLGIAVQP
jgi:peptidoglycan/LPS O-acetylase OafA/YrhL